MANLQKYTQSEMGLLLKHCDRSDPNRQYANQEIDKTKSHLNYNLAPNHGDITDYQFCVERCQNLKVLKRKDVNYMASWLVTLPKDYKGDSKDFFKASYNFLENKYGKENIVSAYVHMDETTPHMHFGFVPVYYDKDKGVEKVNAKKLLTREHLQSFHEELQEYLDKNLQYSCTIVNEETMKMKELQNKSIKDLKKEKSLEIDKKAQEMIEKYKKTNPESLLVQENEKLKKDNNLLEWFREQYNIIVSKFAFLYSRKPNSEDLKELGNLIADENEFFIEDFQEELKHNENRFSQDEEESI